MRGLLLSLALVAAASSARGDTSPTTVAALVNEPEATKLAEPLSAALRNAAPLTRATAARVIGVRNVTDLLPALREALAAEKDAVAAREEIRSLALLGSDDDVATASVASATWPASMDDALALAVARRGGVNAIDLYLSRLRRTRMRAVSELMTRALWGRPELVSYAASRILGAHDPEGWRGLLAALHDSQLAMPPELLVVSLGAAEEATRLASLRQLINAYAVEPARIVEPLRGKLLEARSEKASNSEDFARELLRRMLGAERKDDPRWKEWLDSEEADAFLGNDANILQYLTDDEYRVRHGRCEVQSTDCRIPEKRDNRKAIPSRKVDTPAFTLPDMLPAGLTDAILSDARCRGAWLGVAMATVDSAGRVQKLADDSVDADSSCRKAMRTLLRLSYAANTAIGSGFEGPVLLVKAARQPLCLDEAAPANDVVSRLLRAGGDVKAPIIKKRVEPQFPEISRQQMSPLGKSVIVIMESVISRDGCVRSMRILAQSPFPELNGAAVMALSQWKFIPGFLDGKPVDVIFNLTVNFKLY